LETTFKGTFNAAKPPAHEHPHPQSESHRRRLHRRQDRHVLPTWTGCVAYVVFARKKEMMRGHIAEPILAMPNHQLAPDAASPAPMLAAAPIPQSPPSVSQTAPERLRRLEWLRAKQLITPEEYAAKREQIVAEL